MCVYRKKTIVLLFKGGRRNKGAGSKNSIISPFSLSLSFFYPALLALDQPDQHSIAYTHNHMCALSLF